MSSTNSPFIINIRNGSFENKRKKDVTAKYLWRLRINTATADTAEPL